MILALVLMGVVTFVTGLAGAHAYGLYLGEKGRRETVENLLTSGLPERQPAKLNAPLRTAEQGAQVAEEAAVQKVVAGLRDMANHAGMKVTDAELRQEALRMIAAQEGGFEGSGE